VSISPRTLPSALVCAGCGASPEPDDPYPFRCPGAGAGDDVDHVLRRILDVSAVQLPTSGEEQGDPNPYIRYRRLFHSYHVACAGGIEDAEYCDLVARLEGKSSLGRLGLLIHSTAGFVDAGWDGHLTLELSNVATLPIALYPEMKIGQISFLRMTTPAEHPYGSSTTGSKYQGQRGPTPSRYFLNFTQD